MLNRAVAAAVAVASRYGLTGVRPQVLQDGSNVLVRLAPYPVVARVATETARARAGVERWIERDIRVVRHLAGQGVPVALPSDDPPAGPHVHNGIVLALWRFVPHSPDAPVSPPAFAEALASVHAAMSGLDLSDARGPYGDLAVGLDMVSAPDRLRHDAARLESAMREFPVRALHGDAHPGNVLVTVSNLVWNDFEDAWQGPLGWDLACMRESDRFDGHAAVAAYPGRVPEDEVEVCSRYRRLYGVVWRMFRARTSPAWRAEADRHLAAWLA